MIVWRDGALGDGPPELVPPVDRVGVFTTVGCDGGALYEWPRHRHRLIASLAELLPDRGIVLPHEHDLARLLKAAELRGPARLRVAAAERFGRPVVEASASSIPRAPESGRQLRLGIHRWCGADPAHKVLARRLWQSAGEAARARGFDDALLVDARGRVCETSVGNVFAVRGDRVVTPPAPSRALPGIMREWLLEHLPELGLTPVVTEVQLGDLERADELWVTNAVIGIRAVAQAGERAWGDWPVLTRVRAEGVPAPG